jgi:hypothetical protein
MKQGIELAVNFLVVFILMIVVLGMGLALFFKLKAGTEKINQDITDEVRRQIEEEMIGSGNTISIPFVLKEIDRGKVGYFYAGIENVNDAPYNFKIIVTSGQEDADKPNEPKFIAADSEFTIPPHERTVRKIWFSVPKEAAFKQYIYTVRVCNNDALGLVEAPLVCPAGTYQSLYPPIQKVYVKPH